MASGILTPSSHNSMLDSPLLWFIVLCLRWDNYVNEASLLSKKKGTKVSLSLVILYIFNCLMVAAAKLPVVVSDWLRERE